MTAGCGCGGGRIVPVSLRLPNLPPGVSERVTLRGRILAAAHDQRYAAANKVVGVVTGWGNNDLFSLYVDQYCVVMDWALPDSRYVPLSIPLPRGWREITALVEAQYSVPNVSLLLSIPGPGGCECRSL